jgi:N-formylglutamate amidohydrolase
MLGKCSNGWLAGILFSVPLIHAHRQYHIIFKKKLERMKAIFNHTALYNWEDISQMWACC